MVAAATTPAVWFQTERLTLRPYGPADVDTLQRIFGDPDVRRYQFDDQVMPREWIEEEAAANLARFEQHGHGVALVYLRDDAAGGSSTEPIGFAGFRPFFTPPELQLLYGFLPQFWKRGYATEVARALIARAFDVYGFDEVLGATDPPNVASMRVMERAGMRFLEVVRRDGHDVVYFRIRRRGER